ncbi:cinnamoyl-CoA reductase 2-like isoform X2 [Carex rostrata]
MEGIERGRVCVTGAGGFAASWLVKLLLSKGFVVHGTVRDPSDEKCAHLKKLENATENLELFKADLLDYGSIASSVAGCDGVFHVASPVPSSKVSNPEVEVLEPAVTGTKNVLKASLEAKVKRVIVVSSGTAVYMRPDWPSGHVLDESCWSDEQYCKTIGSWYRLSKTVAEKEAIDFGSKNTLDVITVCPTVIFGPMLQPTVNASSLVLIDLLKGASESVDNTTRNTVDVRDLAEALLLVYQKKEASGRYIASSDCINTRDLINLLKCLFPNYSYPKHIVEAKEGNVLSSKKLQLLGWKYMPLEETLRDSVNYYRKAHLLD